MAAAVASTVEVEASMAVVVFTVAAVAFMAEVVDSAVAVASMVEVSTGVVSALEDFTAAASASADFTVVDFMAAALMPFAQLREQHAVPARIASKPALSAAAVRAFLKGQSPAATLFQAARFSAMPPR